MQIFEAFFVKFLLFASISMPLHAFCRVQAYLYNAKGTSQRWATIACTLSGKFRLHKQVKRYKPNYNNEDKACTLEET